MTRIISIILIIGLISFEYAVASEKFNEEKPISSNKESSELPLITLNDEVLGETLSPISSPLPSSVKPSTEKEILTTLQPSMNPSSFGPSISSAMKPSTESSLSNLLTGEDDSENTSDEEIDNSKLPPTRKLITFDQRQEGQYNIRADLDNFMIVVIPPNPSAGISLLDLLTRSASKRANTKKSNKKHYLYGSEMYDTKSNHFTSERSKHNQNHMSYLNKILQSHQNSNNFLNSNNIVNGNQISDYIEGRTPYRVDISSNIASSELNQEKLFQNSGNDGTDSQIDVIPPPYPINYQHLMKPYHLEIEPHVVQIPVQHSTAHAIPPQVPTNIYNPSSLPIQQQQQQQQQPLQQSSSPLQHNNNNKQQQHQHKKQDQNQRGFLNGNFNPASVARGNFLDFFTRFTNGIGIPGSTSVFLPPNPRTIYPSASTNTNNANGITTTSSSSYFNNDNINNNNNNIGRRYAKSIRDSFIYSPDPDLDIIQFNNILRGDGGNNIYSNYINKHDSTVIKRDIPTTSYYNNNNNYHNSKYPTYFGIQLNSNDATLYPPISYHRIILNNNPANNNNIIGINNNGNSNNYNNKDDDDDYKNDGNDDNSIYDLQQNNIIEDAIKHSDFIENSSNGFNSDVELKLIGATEQCGPDSVRDSYGICRLLSSI
ncbi:probable cyclin-dependent serine/threonine-protein kinase DDB_G0292550 [Condylostylus longicornis]|uniref:probable cyclin-dependent serine/threonine-protein kinase DDB_G0292550 n=1 Tax=Condylostylus longicornis TaxID=2530218 RepID=UPI00244E5A08|nr:probable cyclin-dependent serine/threonine-protein kinase DDB_G0292550 [Condylostylus longicornis]